MTALLEDQVAVVTGAASGNGRAIAITFAEHGADVVVADIQSEPRLGGCPTHELVEKEHGTSSEFVECDVSTQEDLAEAVDIATEFGGLDIMVNNAGITLSESFPETDEEIYEKIMAVNVKGTYFGSQIAARQLRMNGGGNIINVSSDAAIRATPHAPIYAMSKGAVRTLTYALAGKLGPDEIRVNAIHPGATETAFATEDTGSITPEETPKFVEEIPLGRVAQPVDIGKAALFLASDLADYVNGESLVVDGGRLTSV